MPRSAAIRSDASSGWSTMLDLGQLESQALGTHVVALENGLDLALEVGRKQALARHVDRDRADLETLSTPVRELTDRLIEDGQREVVHRVAVFDRRKEVARGGECVVGLAPAHQRLDARDRTGGQLNLGLKDGHDVPDAQRSPQPPLEPEVATRRDDAARSSPDQIGEDQEQDDRGGGEQQVERVMRASDETRRGLVVEERLDHIARLAARRRDRQIDLDDVLAPRRPHPDRFRPPRAPRRPRSAS